MITSKLFFIKLFFILIIAGLSFTLWSQISTPASLPADKKTEKKLIENSVIVFSEEQIEPSVITDYDEIIERPLFFDDRKPYVYVEPEKKQPDTKKKKTTPKKNEQYSLSAIMITSEKKLAIIQSGREKSLQRIALGESIDGWKIENIEPHSVLLKKGNESKNLTLEIKNSNTKQNSTAKTSRQTNKAKEKTEEKVNNESNNPALTDPNVTKQ